MYSICVWHITPTADTLVEKRGILLYLIIIM
jgi:hypothetical protein